jgi:hypothetical protein
MSGFSIIQKKVLTLNDLPGTGTLSHALLAFVHRYNLTARPFNWKFTANDLTALLHALASATKLPPASKPPCPGSPDNPGRTYGAIHLARYNERKPSSGKESS